MAGQATETKPLTDIDVRLVGRDGNAFVILAAVRKAPKEGGREDLVGTFMKEATSGDYAHLLQTCMRYVHVT